MTTRVMQVLVVDDDPTVRVLMRTSLRKAGLAAVVAATGEEGLQRFTEQPFDLVMLDVELPGLSGLEVCRRLREQVGEYLPIVMVTGMEDVDSVERAYDAGATDFFAKPINWTLLGHRVQYLLRSALAMRELAALNARGAAMLNAIPDAMMRVDQDGIVLDLQPARPAVGAVPLPTIGQRMTQRLPTEVAKRLTRRLQLAIETGQVQDTDFAVLGPNGDRRFFESRIARIDDSEALCLVRDITERAEAERALVVSESRLEQAQMMARLGHWHVTLATEKVDWSAQTYRIFGLPQGDPVTIERFFQLVHEHDRAELRARWERCVGSGQPVSCEYRIWCNGRVLWLSESAEVELDDDGRPVAVYGTVQDITERKEAENRIARLAFMDSLTGLPNRTAFLERLEREVGRARIDGRRLALLFMDLDGFKTVNDTLGHDTGDRLLQIAADRLRSVLRPSDIVSCPQGLHGEAELARLGGDEFTALILGLNDPEDAMGAAERVLSALRRPFDVDGRELSLSSSIGIAMFPEDGGDAPSLLKHADTAMYHAKDRGRDNCQFYSAAMTQRAVARMTMERDLRIAIEARQFHLVYQPQCDARSGRVVGLEALLRWTHPQRGLVPPMDFIPLSESNGLIVPIGYWVLREACATVAAWHQDGPPLRLAVNLSPVQLREPDLVPQVLDVLAQTGLAPDQLELEVTESSLMDDTSATMDALQALHDAGVRLALDDFGTGYSSMGYLKRMPVSKLKIDRSFVSGLPGDRDNEAIVQAILSMARNLEFEVTAEGVENAAQADLLRRAGCDLLQGFHIGRPMLAQDVSRLWAHAVPVDQPA